MKTAGQAHETDEETRSRDEETGRAWTRQASLGVRTTSPPRIARPMGVGGTPTPVGCQRHSGLRRTRNEMSSSRPAARKRRGAPQCAARPSRSPRGPRARRPRPGTSDAPPERPRSGDGRMERRMRRYFTPHCDVTLYQRQSSVWSSNPPRAGGASAHARPAPRSQLVRRRA